MDHLFNMNLYLGTSLNPMLKILLQIQKCFVFECSESQQYHKFKEGFKLVYLFTWLQTVEQMHGQDVQRVQPCIQLNPG